MDEVITAHLNDLQNGTVTDINKARKKKAQQQRESEDSGRKRPSAADMAEDFHAYCVDVARQYLVFWKGAYFIYKGNCYTEYSKQDVEMAIAAFVRTRDAVTRENASLGYLGTIERFFCSMVKIPSSVEENTFIDNPSAGNGFLAVKNGILSIDRFLEDSSEPLLLPHTPKFFSLTCLAYDYNPAAESSVLKDFMGMAVPDQEVQNFLQEWAGYNLTHDVDEIILILQGEGANGKSVYGQILKNLLGRGNYAAVQPEDLGRDDKLYSLLGMRANICDDMNENVPLKFGTIKGLASGADVTVSRKYKAALTFNPVAKHTWICNHFPNITDRSEGTMRRIVPITFENTVPIEKRNPQLKKESYWTKSGQMSGVLNWALKGLRRYRERGCVFEIPACALSQRETIRVDSQPELQFFEECLEFGEGQEFVSGTGLLHEAYLKWMKGSKSGMKQSTFVRAMKKRFPLLEYNANPTTNMRWTGRQRAFIGVRLAASVGTGSYQYPARDHHAPRPGMQDSLAVVHQEKVMEETTARVQTIQKRQDELQKDVGDTLDAVVNVFLAMLGESGIAIDAAAFRSRVHGALAAAAAPS